MKVRKAVIPCAGFGTRFLPVTKVLAKELLPIVDTPALTYIVDEAVKSGIEEIMIVISPQKEDIRRLFEPNEPLNARLKEVGDEYSYSLANKEVGAKVSFVVQEKMDGNANAIYLCKKFANGEPFAVLFGDDVMYKRMAFLLLQSNLSTRTKRRAEQSWVVNIRARKSRAVAVL